MILNSFILLNCCYAELSHRDFRFTLVSDLIQEGGRVLLHQTTPWEAPPASTSWLEVQGSEHCPEKGNHMQCHMFHPEEIQ